MQGGLGQSVWAGEAVWAQERLRGADAWATDVMQCVDGGRWELEWDAVQLWHLLHLSSISGGSMQIRILCIIVPHRKCQQCFLSDGLVCNRKVAQGLPCGAGRCCCMGARDAGVHSGTSHAALASCWGETSHQPSGKSQPRPHLPEHRAFS